MDVSRLNGVVNELRTGDNEFDRDKARARLIIHEKLSKEVRSFRIVTIIFHC